MEDTEYEARRNMVRTAGIAVRTAALDTPDEIEGDLLCTFAQELTEQQLWRLEQILTDPTFGLPA